MGQLAQNYSALAPASGPAMAVGSPQQMLSTANKVGTQGVAPQLASEAGSAMVGRMLPGSGIDTTQSSPDLPFLRRATVDEAGTSGSLQGPNMPALTKGGKLLSILRNGLQGALAGRAAEEQSIVQSGGHTRGGFGVGAQAAMVQPYQLAEERAQAELAQGGLQPVETPFGQMPAALAVKIFPSYLGMQGRLGAAQIGAGAKEDVANISANARITAEQIGQRYKITPQGLVDTQAPRGPNGELTPLPGTENGFVVTPEYAQDHGLSQDYVGKFIKTQEAIQHDQAIANYLSKFAPQTRTEADSLGVSSTSTTQKQLPNLPFLQSVSPSGQLPVPRGATPSFLQGKNTNQPQSTSSNAQGGTAGQTLTPQQAKMGTVDLIGQYRMNFQNLNRLLGKHPDLPAIVAQKYPDWDQTNYQAKQKAITSFTSGPDARRIDATNIALDHVQRAYEAIDALNNNNAPILKRLANFYDVQVGKDNVTTYKAIIQKLGPELAQAYIAGGGGEAERAGIQSSLDPGLGQQQLRSNLAKTASLFQPNIDTMEQRYRTTVGRNDFRQRFLTPEAQKVLSTLGSGKPQTNQTVNWIRQNGQLVAAPAAGRVQ